MVGQARPSNARRASRYRRLLGALGELPVLLSDGSVGPRDALEEAVGGSAVLEPRELRTSCSQLDHRSYELPAPEGFECLVDAFEW